ncbi:hypothetical protein GCM10023215_65800 [Pseudonocardia yuanmonensis]|uniref:Uncharacterized protein n=1 Tax=Pseudonocardia yuanmonensis TaxID=1095914 RepID=A0ABP8XRV3_9PSEU
MSPTPDPFPPLPPAPPHPAGRPCAHLCTPDCTAEPEETGTGWPEDGC